MDRPESQPIQLRVHVDRERCQAHTRCFAVAPHVFELDDLGYSHEIGDGLVPPDHVEQARLAVANCPEEAISIQPA